MNVLVEHVHVQANLGWNQGFVNVQHTAWMDEKLLHSNYRCFLAGISVKGHEPSFIISQRKQSKRFYSFF